VTVRRKAIRKSVLIGYHISFPAYASRIRVGLVGAGLHMGANVQRPIAP